MRLVIPTVALFAVLGLGSTRANAPVRTLQTTSSPVVSVAQDGDWIAWTEAPIAGTAAPCVRTRNLRTGTTYVLARPGGATCGWALWYEQSMAVARLGGPGALWAWQTESMVTYHTGVVVGRRGQPDRKLAYYGQFKEDATGSPAAYKSFAAAGDAATLAWLDPTRGVVHVVAPVRRTLTVGATAIAVAGSDLAYAARSGDRISVRSVATNRERSTFAAAGRVQGLALTATRVAVLVDAGGGTTRLDVSTRGGENVLSLVVAASSSRTVSMAGDWVVYAGGDGRAVHAVDVARGTDTVVVRTRRPAAGLSIEGRRVVWGDGYSVRALALPPA